MAGLKFVILILIVLVSTKIGYLKSESYKIRVNSLKKINEALLYLKTKIEFTYEPIKTIFEEISSIVFDGKDNIFKLSVENMNANDSINESWISSVDAFEKSFKKEDIDIIKSFGKLLGRTDKKGQISEIEITRICLERNIILAEKEKEKNGKLYKTLGIVSGFATCIILI